MVFKCQSDSFLKEFSSAVVSCKEAEFIQKEDETIHKGFNVILEDSILFPEGGGQPCDYGFLNDKPVINVIRNGEKAIHFIKSDEAFSVGQIVNQKIDWERRLDHMQQHSGQHLITAVFYNDYGYKTTTWNLGTESSFIELDAKVLTTQQITDVEAKVNKLIADRTEVTILTIASNNTSEIPAEVTRAMKGLPKDHKGAIRVVCIDGIDSNMCCGTHVRNLSELQMIKLLHVEKHKGNYLVHFVTGNRVLKKLQETYAREIEFNVLLNCGPPTHIEMLKKMKVNLKIAQRNVQKVLKELAIEEARKVNTINDNQKYYCLHRKDGLDPDFFNTFLRNISNEKIFFFLTTSDDSGKGNMILKGYPDDVEQLAPELCVLLDGKGNGKNGKYQAKINNLKKIAVCEKRVKLYFDGKTMIE